jgi:hypothetical protein
MHVHVSALSTLIVAAQVILILAGFLWLSVTFSDRPIGQAFAALTNA